MNNPCGLVPGEVRRVKILHISDMLKNFDRADGTPMSKYTLRIQSNGYVQDNEYSIPFTKEGPYWVRQAIEAGVDMYIKCTFVTRIMPEIDMATPEEFAQYERQRFVRAPQPNATAQQQQQQSLPSIPQPTVAAAIPFKDSLVSESLKAMASLYAAAIASGEMELTTDTPGDLANATYALVTTLRDNMDF